MRGTKYIPGTKKAGEEAHPPPSDAEYRELHEKYEEAGQGQVFAYWDELKPEEKGALYAQLEPIDPEHINKIVDKAVNPPKDEGEAKLEPLPGSATTSTIDSPEDQLNKWYNDGLKMISEGKVGVVLMVSPYT